MDAGRRRVPQKNQTFGSFEAKGPVKIWADEEIQQQFSAMGRK